MVSGKDTPSNDKNNFMWYYAVNRDRKGPLDEAGLWDLIRNGTINGQTRIWGEGITEWTRLDSSPLAHLLTGARPTPGGVAAGGYAGGGQPYGGYQQYAGQPSAWKKIFFISAVLKHLSEGRLMHLIFAYVVRILAVLLVVLGLVGWINMWRVISDLDGFGVLGGIFFQLFFLVGLYMVAHISFIRARDVLRLPDSPFKSIPIVSVYIRMAGEIYACLMVTFAVAGGLLILFAGNRLGFASGMARMPLLGMLSIFGHFTNSDSSFVSALLHFLFYSLGAFFTLVVSYFLAESVLVLVDIAVNVRALRGGSAQGSAGSTGA